MPVIDITPAIKVNTNPLILSTMPKIILSFLCSAEKKKSPKIFNGTKVRQVIYDI